MKHLASEYKSTEEYVPSDEDISNDETFIEAIVNDERILSILNKDDSSDLYSLPDIDDILKAETFDHLNGAKNANLLLNEEHTDVTNIAAEKILVENEESDEGKCNENQRKDKKEINNEASSFDGDKDELNFSLLSKDYFSDDSLEAKLIFEEHETTIQTSNKLSNYEFTEDLIFKYTDKEIMGDNGFITGHITTNHTQTNVKESVSKKYGLSNKYTLNEEKKKQQKSLLNPKKHNFKPNHKLKVEQNSIKEIIKTDKNKKEIDYATSVRNKKRGQKINNLRALFSMKGAINIARYSLIKSKSLRNNLKFSNTPKFKVPIAGDNKPINGQKEATKSSKNNLTVSNGFKKDKTKLTSNNEANEETINTGFDATNDLNKIFNLNLKKNNSTSETQIQSNIRISQINGTDNIKRSGLFERFNCNICSYSTTKKMLLESHLRFHSKEAHKKILSCEHCSYITKNKTHLWHHLRTHTGEKPFTCNICQKCYTTKSSLMKHLMNHTGEKRFECDVCGKKFAWRNDLLTHEATHSDNKPFTCDFCPKKFALKTNLYRHRVIHSDVKPFACDICQKRFTRKNNLALHLKTHTGDKRFACDKCKKRFSRRSDLTAHEKIHAGVKPFACEVCSTRFLLKSNLNSHRLTHTGNKPFACNMCPSKYTVKSNLLKHLKTHDIDTFYSCTICDYKISDKGQLSDHMKSHIGEKHFKCHICHYGFTKRCNLRRHMKTHAR